VQQLGVLPSGGHLPRPRSPLHPPVCLVRGAVPDDIDCDLAPVAAGGGWTADMGLTVPHTGLCCILRLKVCYMCLHLMQ